MIDHESGLPLYLQLNNIIKNQITTGVYHPGEKIPTEEEFCKKYGISRITVRQAINNLVQDKMLIRKQGKGTYVAYDKLKKTLPRLYSFTEDVKAAGRVPDSVIMEQQLIEADPETAELLRLPETNRMVNKIVRVRRADQMPILLETTFIPDYLCPKLNDYDFSSGSLYSVLQKDFKLTVQYAEERYEVAALTRGEAEILEAAVHEPAFSIHRLAFIDRDRPVELTSSLGKGDAMSFSLTLVPETKFKRHY